MTWEMALIGVGSILFILLIVVLSSIGAVEQQKKIDENTIKKMSKEQLREFIAEHLGVKPSQIKFRISDNDIVGIRVMKYEE